MKFEYDMEKEMKKLHKKSDKILIKYPNVIGLRDILNMTLDQYDSKSFNNITWNLEKYANDFDKKDIWGEMDTEAILDGDIDSIDDRFQLLKHSTILKDSKFFLGSLNDTIVFSHFISLVTFNIGILTMKGNGEITHLSVYGLTNKLMVLLENFDQDISFNLPDEHFFKELKAVKWDKKANKLFDKISSLQSDVASLVITELFLNIRKIFVNYRFSLGMLVACSAINRGSDKMEYEDVICAFRTFYKLIDADIDDLI